MNISTLIISLIIAAIGVIAILSYKKRLKNGCCGGGGGEIKIAPADSDETHYPYKAVVSVGGMTCGNCAARIENAFNRRGGMMARVRLRKKRAEIWSVAPIDEDDIRRTIEGMDYTVLNIENDTKGN